MQPFVISFNDWSKPGPDKYQCVFYAKQGELEFPIAITLDELRPVLHKKEVIKDKLPKIGLGYVLRKLESGDYPDETTRIYQDISLNPDLFEAGMDEYSRKGCKFQTKTLAGLICEAAFSGDDLQGWTSQPLCDECEIPDSRFLCAHLSHPESYSSASSKSRMMSDAMCEKKQDPEKTGGCNPGGKACWEFVFEFPKEVQKIPADLPERVADEIDFLNLVFREVHGSRILDILVVRSISDLHGSCSTKQQFIFKVQVVADLIDKLTIPENQLKEKPGENEGRLDIIERFLSESYPGSSTTLVSGLRDIRRVRHGFPAHSGTEKKLAAALENLDIPYPIDDYQKAWEKILWTFYAKLKELRLVVETKVE